MQLKLIPVLLILGLTTVLGACETASENTPSQPGTQVDTPEGGAELDNTESPKYPAVPETEPQVNSPADTSGAPAVPDAEIPAAPGSPTAPDASPSNDSPAP